jgi:threonylcarbamoyladenosine tRNA methylthiotransferase MtaB
MKFYIKTLGCKMNWLDSARLSAALQLAGHEKCLLEDEADQIYINSCTVTAEADRKSRQMANAALNKSERVNVMGCSVRVDPVQWQGRGVNSFASLDEIIQQIGIEPSYLPEVDLDRTRLPIAIQTGCDDHCTFCITRIARGQHQSIPAAQIIREINHYHESGINEVVLIGINLAAWGTKNTCDASGTRFGELLQQILQQTTIPRIRLSSLGPQYLHSGFWDAYSDERICDYLHISLQSGSASVLSRMKRGHGTAEVEHIAEESRRRRPNTALAADIISCFVQESDTEHQQTLDLLQHLAFAKLHIFPYSVRQGTEAANMSGEIATATRMQRLKQLRELAQRLRQRYIAKILGQPCQILVEGNQRGLTSHYIRVHTGNCAENTIITQRLTPELLAE